MEPLTLTPVEDDALHLTPIDDALHLTPVEDAPAPKPVGPVQAVRNAVANAGNLMLSQAEFEQQDIKPVQLPVVGQEGSFVRGASKGVSGLVEAATTPEGVALGAAMLIPGVGQVLGPVLGAAAVKQAAQLAGEYSVTGNPETLGEATVMGTAGILGTALPLEGMALDAVKAWTPATGAALERGSTVLRGAEEATKAETALSESAAKEALPTKTAAEGGADQAAPTIETPAGKVEPAGEVSELSTVEAIKALKEKYTNDQIEAGFSRYQSERYGLNTEGMRPSAKATQLALFAKDIQRGEPRALEAMSEGPGAASPGDVPTAPQLEQLTETLKGVKPVKQPFMDQVRNQYEITKEQLATKAENTLGALKNFGTATVNALKGEHAWTDFKDALGKFSGEQNRNDFALREFTNEIKRAVPDKLRREAIVNWIQADGDKAILAERAGSSKGYGRGYELAQDLTPDELTLADNVRSYLDSKLKEGMDAGILKAGVENYITQLWDRPNPITQKLIGEIFTGKLAPNFKYARQRIFNSYFEGEQAGYKPKIKDVGALTAIYDQAFSRAIASRRLIKSLHEGKASDGRPLVEVSGGTSAIKAEEGASPEAIMIRPKARPQEVGDYLPIDHPALRGWKWAARDENGAPIFVSGDLLVHPEIHGKLKNILSTSWFRQNVFTRSLLGAMSMAKQTKLSLSGFHFTQEAAHAASHRVNPAAPVEIDFSNPAQSALVDHGLQVADYRAYQAFAEGLSGAGGLLEKIPVVGPKVFARINEYLFQEYIPRLKMSMALDALERNRARFKDKLTDDQILELTSNQANAAFGELNYTMLARNPHFQDLLRLTLLAPDFLEARGRFMSQALTKTGTEQRVALGLQALTMYVGARLLNQAVSGDPHWEPERMFAVHYKGKDYSIRTVVEDAFHAVDQPAQFIANRLAPLARATTEFVTGRDWRGVKRDTLEQVQDFADWLVPISLDKQVGNTRLDQTLAASGVVVKKATAQLQIYKLLDDFKKEHNLLTKEEKEGLRAASEYAPLRRALEADDMATAKKEYDRLLEPSDNLKPKTPQQIRSHFANSVRQPFSGSPRLEQQFLHSLDKKGTDLYLEAQRERRETAAKFLQAQQDWKKAK